MAYKNAAAASATQANGSSTAAAASATLAQTQVAQLGALLASFRSVYLGELPADPTTDPNGDPLVEGAQYFNSTTGKLRVYTDGAWEDFSAQNEVNNAQLSASNAAASATAAQVSETNADASATAAAASAAAAAASAAAVAAAVATLCGMLGEFPAGVVPNDSWYILDGSLKSRTTDALLWAYAQASGNLAASDAAWTSGQFSPGDGATTFRIPYFAGAFSRALDLGRGVDVGRTTGSWQTDATRAHNHGVTDPGHAHGVSDPGHNHGVNDPGHSHSYNDHPNTDQGGGNGGAVGGFQAPQTSSSRTGIWLNPSGTGISIAAAATGIAIQNSVGAETRPVNIAVLKCIHRGVV